MWASAPYNGALQFTPPDGPTVDFYRGNFCGKRVPTLPWLSGMAGRPGPNGEASLVMDLDVAKYGPTNTDAQDKFFAQSIADGYTHLQISCGDFDSQGWTIAQTVAYALRWKALGGFVDVWLLNGGGGFGAWSVRDSEWSQNAPLVTPWVEAFISAGAMDWICLGWQLDGNASGWSLLTNIIGLGNLLAGLVPYYGLHWINLANAWWDDRTAAVYGIRDRFSFWAWMAANAHMPNRTHMQYDVNAPISAPGSAGGAQGSIRDVVRSLKPGQLVVPYEYAAQDQFDTPDQRPEISGNERGWYALCSSPLLGGYGNGAQRPDGTAL